MLGFNVVIFSFGTYLLAYSKENKFEIATVFSPPVVATLLGLLVVFWACNACFRQ
jgi:predicted permease